MVEWGYTHNPTMGANWPRCRRALKTLTNKQTIIQPQNVARKSKQAYERFRWMNKTPRRHRDTKTKLLSKENVFNKLFDIVLTGMIKPAQGVAATRQLRNTLPSWRNQEANMSLTTRLCLVEPLIRSLRWSTSPPDTETQSASWDVMVRLSTRADLAEFAVSSNTFEGNRSTGSSASYTRMSLCWGNSSGSWTAKQGGRGHFRELVPPSAVPGAPLHTRVVSNQK